MCVAGVCCADIYDVFEVNGKVGLKDANGKVIIPAEYEALGWSEGAFTTADGVTGYKLDGKWGLINMNNHRITKPLYTMLLPGEGTHLVAFLKDNGKVNALAGCISTAGKVLIPFSYDGLKISGMRAIAIKKASSQFVYGLVDLDNKVLIPVIHKNIWPLGSLRFAVENTGGKIALYAEDGRQVVPFTINRIEPFQNNFAVIHQNGNLGLIDREGKVAVEPVYRELTVSAGGKVEGRKGDEWIVLDGDNHVLQTLQADSIVGLGENIFKIANAGEVRLFTDKFTVLSETAFDDVQPFHGGRAVFTRDNLQGVIDAQANLVVENRYSQLWLHDGYCVAFQKKSSRWLLLSERGDELTSKNYDLIGGFNGAFFPARHRGYWGGINKLGKEIITCVYDSLLAVTDNRVVVKFRGQYGVINTDEDWLVTPQASKVISISSDRYLTSSGTTTTLKASDGGVIYFTDNAIVYKEPYLEETTSNGGIWKINLDGQIVSRQLPPQEPYEVIFPATEEFRGIRKDGRYGFIDDQGRLRIANRYEGIQPFNEGVAAIKIRGRWGFIDLKETLIIQPTFDEVSDFRHGMSVVRQGNMFGLLDISGKVVLPVRYDRIERLSNKRFKIYSQQLEGLADADGRVLVMPKYETVTDLDNGYVLVGRDGKYGLLTTQGVSTIPMMYGALTYDKLNNRYLALKKSEWTTIR